MTLAHHPGVDIAAIEEANGQRAPIPIPTARRAINSLAADPNGERERGRPSARPGAAAFARRSAPPRERQCSQAQCASCRWRWYRRRWRRGLLASSWATPLDRGPRRRP